MTHLKDSATTHVDACRAVPEVLDHATIVPIRHGRRTIDAYVMTAEGVRFAALTPVAVTVRRPAAILSVTMGPGGWVSLEGMAVPSMRNAGGSAKPCMHVASIGH